MEILRNVHAKNLVKWAEDKKDAYLLSADLTSSCEAHLFKEAYPERFLSMGIAEQNMLAFAGGMAREGLVPLIHTFAVFIYRRAYDQIAMSVAYPNLPVKMFGFYRVFSHRWCHASSNRRHFGYAFFTKHDHY